MTTLARAPAFAPIFAQERWIARQLDPCIFAGVTTPQVRRERVRSTIVTKNLANVRAGFLVSARGHRKPETWGQLFKRVYGQELDTHPVQLNNTTTGGFTP